jgi:hypothetical protein
MGDYGVAWIKQTLSMSTQGQDMAISMATDNNGYLYIAYRTDGTVSGGNKYGSYDIVILKMDGSGNVIWIKQNSVINTTGIEDSPRIVIDTSNNIYISYITTGTVSGGTHLGASNSTDLVIIKLNTDGDIIWIKEQTNVNSASDERLPKLAIDKNNYLFISYFTSGSVSGGINYGNRDMVICKMDSNGGTLWIKQLASLNTSDTEFSASINFDSNNYLYGAYQTTGKVSGGTLLGEFDIVVFKMDSDGNLIWIKQQRNMNTNSRDTTPNLVIDNSNNIYINYMTSGTTSGGRANNNNLDTVIFKMDSNGNLLWIRQQEAMNTTGDDIGDITTMVIDSFNNIYVTYFTDSSVSGGTFLGAYDIVLLKMNSNGSLVWIKQERIWNTTLEDQYPTMTIDSNDNIYVSYTSYGTISGGTYKAFGDIVVVKFSPIITVFPSTPMIEIRPFVESQKITYYWGLNDSTISSVKLSCIGPSGGVATLTSNTRQYTFSNLTNSSNYAAAIVGFDMRGLQSISSLYRTVQPGSLPNPPLNVVFTKIGDSIQVTWDAPAVQDSEIKWYFLNSTDNSYSFGIEPFKREFTSTSISAGTYTWVLRAVNDAGYGTAVYSSPFTF